MGAERWGSALVRTRGALVAVRDDARRRVVTAGATAAHVLVHVRLVHVLHDARSARRRNAGADRHPDRRVAGRDCDAAAHRGATGATSAVGGRAVHDDDVGTLIHDDDLPRGRPVGGWGRVRVGVDRVLGRHRTTVVVRALMPHLTRAGDVDGLEVRVVRVRAVGARRVVRVGVRTHDEAEDTGKQKEQRFHWRLSNFGFKDVVATSIQILPLLAKKVKGQRNASD